MRGRKSKGIFCLEGPWSSKLTDKSTVRPLLEVVNGEVESNFIFRDVSTEEELRKYLKQWTQRQYMSHPIGILSFHGYPGGIWIGQKRVPLDVLGELLGGRCGGRLLHFDSCETFKIKPSKLEEFRKVTKATGVSGFTENVDWLESAAFTLNLLSEVTSSSSVPTALGRLKRDHARSCSRLGFRAVWQGGRIGIAGRQP